MMPIDPTALKGLSRRELAALKAAVEKELVTCAICSNEGAMPFLLSANTGALKGRRASIDLCLPCFEKHRHPVVRIPGRAPEGD